MTLPGRRFRPLLPPRLRALRLLLPVGVLAVVLAVLLGGGLLVIGQFTLGGGGRTPGTCDTGADAGGAPGGAAATDPGSLGPDQRQAAGVVIDVGRGMAAPPRSWVVALAAAMQESRMGRLGMDRAVDHDSVGLFQQRPSQGWGTPDQLRDPAFASRAFLTRLLAVPDWDKLPVTRAAQIVQHSAFPGAYAQWEPLAAALVGRLGGVDDAVRDCSSATTPGGSGVGPTLAPEVSRAAVGSALAETGKPYVWGATGPGAYDCSGLTQHAYAGAGVVLPRTAREQFGAGAHLPVAEAVPGDLLFFAYDPQDPDTIHHVGIYLGDGRLMEARQTGVPLGVRPVSFTEPGLVPLAARPGTAVGRS